MAGNLSHSMRDNYSTHGVKEYYTIVSSSYRNPHFPAVQKCLHAWLDRWWIREKDAHHENSPVMFWDLAAGSGEVTEAILNWYNLRRRTPADAEQHSASTSSAGRVVVPPRKKGSDISLEVSVPNPLIVASDPYTAPAYTAHTSLPCAPLSFLDIAEGQIPESPQSVHDDLDGPPPDQIVVDMVISSFALHLCSESELFVLLYELSTKARWLVVIAPHKKPEIKPGWGWVRWDLAMWSGSQGDRAKDSNLEILLDRVHLRVFRSVNI